jgi:hypothetical protein
MNTENVPIRARLEHIAQVPPDRPGFEIRVMKLICIEIVPLIIPEGRKQPSSQ